MGKVCGLCNFYKVGGHVDDLGSKWDGCMKEPKSVPVKSLQLACEKADFPAPIKVDMAALDELVAIDNRRKVEAQGVKCQRRRYGKS